MLKKNFKEIFTNIIIVLLIFLTDRVSKIYILKMAELENTVDIYINSYLNFYLIWNKGIAFGLFSFNENFIYNIITLIITIIVIVVLIMLMKAKGFRKYSLIFVLGGSLGNLFDRVYYSAVPDFIDFHINNFHWFIFNVADIFITLGIICLIFDEIFGNNNNKNENVV
jgi:signal peptidase II|tara:strand:- start:3116 stop:3619 length:504 start_codon:yes stop_codon:yes gene_type:complete